MQEDLNASDHRECKQAENAKFSQCIIAGGVQLGGESYIVWTGICLEAKTGQHVCWRSSANAQTYIMDFLEEYVETFTLYINGNF